MRLTTLQLRVVASFGVALIVIATGWIGAGALTSALETRDEARRSRQLVDTANSVRTNLLEAETSERGYLLTGDDAYLRAYRAALDRPNPLEALERPHTADPEVASTLERLAKNLGDKRAETAATLEVAKALGKPAALAMVAEGRGQRLSEAIRVDLDELVRREKLRRDDLYGGLDAKVKLARVVVLSGTLIAFALAVLVNVSLMGAVRAREEAQRIVEQQAAQLRLQTGSLMQHEEQLANQLVKSQQLAQALRASNEELDQFAYATSHDLKAPLRGIINLSTFIEEDLGKDVPPGVKENLELLRGRARRLEALIEGILAYSRAGRVRTKVERVETEALVREVIELIAPPPACAITVKGPMPVLETERVPMQQVFMNLIQNAIKHGCPGGCGNVEVGFEANGEISRFYVRDQGPGIAPEFHERVFGVFQTLAPRDKVEGTGIGLAVVKKLIESRGGSVELASQVGEGASFRFAWPSDTVTP